MGCCVSTQTSPTSAPIERSEERADKRTPRGIQTPAGAVEDTYQNLDNIADPRWDTAGFDAFVASSAPFVRVGELRAAKNDGRKLVASEFAQQWLIPSGCGIASGVQLFAVLSSSLHLKNPTPVVELAAILAVLDEESRSGGAIAGDDDLVFWDQVAKTGGGVRHGMFRMFTHARVQSIVLMAAPLELAITERLETMAYLALTAFCQRLVNASDPAVRAACDLEKLMDLPNTLASLHCETYADYQRIAVTLEQVIRALTPVGSDEVGFERLCAETGLMWLRAPYVRQLAKRGGPCPRQQDLDPAGVIVGVPRGRRLSVSHGWDSQHHVSPDGAKLSRLALALEQLGAVDAEDGVFIDYCSLPQRAAADMPSAYLEANGLEPPLPDRTREQARKFTFALWEMSRLYAYKEMEVIVLPQAADPQGFPGGASAWGHVNPDPYVLRGWCTSEFSITRFMGRIANADDPAVREVEAARPWPRSVPEYEAMMNAEREDGDHLVRFTSKGDRELVTFMFFRVCFGMLHSFFPDEASPQIEFAAPSDGALQSAARLEIGRGDPQRQYYLYMAVAPPAFLAGDYRPRHAAILQSLRTLLLADQDKWLQRQQWPVCVGDGVAKQLQTDLTKGQVHCLVWGAPGFGWETIDPNRPAAATLDGLCSAMSKLPAAKRPRLTVVCLPFGARKAAERLLQSGAPLVLWVQRSLLDSDHHAALLLGLIAPLLEMLHQPRMRHITPPALTEAVRTLAGPLHRTKAPTIGCLVPASSPLSLPIDVWVPPPPSAVWVHHLATTLPEVCSREATALGEELHEAIQLAVCEGSSGKRIEILTRAPPPAVCEWIGRALPSGSADPIAALYIDADLVTNEPLLQARLYMQNVGFLHELRDAVLTGELESTLSANALKGSRYRVAIDRSEFARRYEASVLSLDKLTPHQLEKLQECLEGRSVHLKAPAGAGKTFVALYRVLELLVADAEATVLFVAHNPALCYFIVRWICQRVPNSLQRLALLRRVHLLFAPFADGPRAVQLKRGQIAMTAASATSRNALAYTLVVVDEAHHIYKDAQLRQLAEPYTTASRHLLLLSDVSQSTGRDIEYPAVPLLEVALEEVVRSSQRIVAAAASFQLGTSERQVVCQHNATGPPLKSFLFDLDGPRGLLWNAYAEHTVRALQHVMNTFGTLSLHNRVAILVPDKDFLTAFVPVLETALLEMPTASQRRLVIINATQAAALVMASSDGDDSEEWLVVDTMAAFDGLERLIVIAVGLDAVIDDSSGEGGEGTLETRSRLYRALTRAHMLAVVVNEVISGGFLAFLGRLKLQSSEGAQQAKFDRAKAMQQQEATAAQDVTNQALEVAKKAGVVAGVVAATVLTGGAALAIGAAVAGASAAVNQQQVPAASAGASTTANQQQAPAAAPSQPPAAADPAAVKKPAAAPKKRPARKAIVTQSIWDTSENAASVATVDSTFQPFKQSAARRDGHPGRTGVTHQFIGQGVFPQSSQGKWHGAALLDGCIYALPETANSLLKIDTATQNVTEILQNEAALLKTASWNLIAGPDGKLYSWQKSSPPTLLQIDVAAPSVRRVQPYFPPDLLISECTGGVLAPDGCIYFIQNQQSSGTKFVIKLSFPLNSTPQVTTIVSNDPQSRTRESGSYWGGVLGPDGCVYGIPQTPGTPVLRIDTAAEELTFFGQLPDDLNRTGVGALYCSGALASDGCIYCAPRKATRFLKIDPASQQVSLVGRQLASQDVDLCFGTVAGADGFIYGTPFKDENIFQLNPQTGDVQTFRCKRGGWKWNDACLAPDGSIYATPCHADSVLRIDPPVPRGWTMEGDWHDPPLLTETQLWGQPTTTTGTPRRGRRSGAILKSREEIQALAASATSIRIVDADDKSRYVKLKAGVTWPIERLKLGYRFDSTLEGDPVSRELAADTWEGTMVDSMWNEIYRSDPYYDSHYSRPILDPANPTRFYHACSNHDGLHLNAGEECEFQYQRAAAVEVWIEHRATDEAEPFPDPAWPFNTPPTDPTPYSWTSGTLVLPKRATANGGTVWASDTYFPNHHGGSQGPESLVDGKGQTKYCTIADLPSRQIWQKGELRDTMHWIAYQPPLPLTFSSYTMTSANDVPGRDPQDWVLEAREADGPWVQLDAQTSGQFGARQQSVTFQLKEPAVDMSMIRLRVLHKRDDSLPHFQLAALVFNDEGEDATEGIPKAKLQVVYKSSVKCHMTDLLDSNGIQQAYGEGYSKMWNGEGYGFTEQREGMVPLRRYWNGVQNRNKDDYTGLKKPGDDYQGGWLVCYVYENHRPGTVALEIWGGVASNNVTISAENAEAKAWLTSQGYSLNGNAGWVARHGDPNMSERGGRHKMPS